MIKDQCTTQTGSARVGHNDGGTRYTGGYSGEVLQTSQKAYLTQAVCLQADLCVHTRRVYIVGRSQKLCTTYLVSMLHCL